MKKRWSIDEILIKLPIVNIKLRAPVVASGEARKEEERIVFVEGLRGMKVGFKSFTGSFVGADMKRNGTKIKPDRISSNMALVSTKLRQFSMIRWHGSLTMNFTRQTKSAK